MQILVLVGLFIAEKSCHKLNMNAMDNKPLNSTLTKLYCECEMDKKKLGSLSIKKIPE